MSIGWRDLSLRTTGNNNNKKNEHFHAIYLYKKKTVITPYASQIDAGKWELTLKKKSGNTHTHTDIHKAFGIINHSL